MLKKNLRISGYQVHFFSSLWVENISGKKKEEKNGQKFGYGTLTVTENDFFGLNKCQLNTDILDMVKWYPLCAAEFWVLQPIDGPLGQLKIFCGQGHPRIYCVVASVKDP